MKKANELLDNAGWKQKDSEGFRTKDGNRLSVKFVYASTNVEAADVALFRAVQYQVKQAGFDVQLTPVDAGEFTTRTNANEYDIASNFFVRAEPDILRTVFDSAYAPPNGNNFTRISVLNDKLRKAIGAGEAERKQLYSEIQREVIDQAYVVPLYIPAYQLGLSKQVQGISWATNAKPNFYDVWIKR